ncbi:unknown [Crocosphaera subtropica ATCC 51142]|uniref:Bacterial Pleckstrin homology domain-containing protein n=1 Tax=Crocosphaera subtropica (strain ATCC 51142 / BH68) TaxID=43989 RepID=B1X1M9_CROS5|nr:PH domain-containing protein [Crocosphaera subtropica]ACB53059.1 unknown [Crocosphaera subtropica ATCC 51142]
MSQVFPMVPASSKTLWSIGILAVLMLGVLCLCLLIAYSSQQVKFEIDQQQLMIKGDLYGRNIPLKTLVIEEAKVIQLDQSSSYRPRWRTNGIGLPGYRSGWFKLKNGEKALLFVTELKEVVYLPTLDNYSLLMSVKNPDDFVEALKN